MKSSAKFRLSLYGLVVLYSMFIIINLLLRDYHAASSWGLALATLGMLIYENKTKPSLQNN